MGYLTVNEFDRIQTLGIALPQAELRRQKILQITSVYLSLGQRLELSSLNVHLIQILTPGVVPSVESTSLGIVSAGLYLYGGMMTGGLGVAAASSPGVSSISPLQPVVVTAPGRYSVMVSNNSNNVDVSVAVTGSLRIFS
jgi:hypothetical protein